MASVPFLVVWSLPRLYSMDAFCQEKISNYVNYQIVSYNFIEKYQLTSKMVNFWSKFQMSKKMSEKQLFSFSERIITFQFIKWTEGYPLKCLSMKE